MTPLVSIIVVTFNAAEHIENAIKSFLNQNFESKELIIIDGNSKDNTVRIIQKFQSENIRWLSEPDNGIYDAMNKGVHLAKGEWIYFLGSDDYFVDENVLSRVFTNNLIGVDFLYGNVIMSPKNKIYDGPFDRRKILFKNICHQAIFYRKSIFNTLGLYNIRYKSLADWHFNIKCFFTDKIQVKYTPQLIANFASGGISKQNTDLAFFREFLFPINLQQLNEGGLQKLINIQFYDSWWRLLRSLRLRGKMDLLNQFAGKERVPKVIQHMFNLQQKVHLDILKNGFVSKTLMFLSYGRSLTNNSYRQ